MSDQPISSESKAKRILGSFGILAVFGFLALIFVQGVQTESLEERAYKGEFDAATIEQRWVNFEEVSKAQKGLLDRKKLSAAMSQVVKASEKGAKSEMVVPGSPTFLKQMEAASAPAKPEPAKPEPAKPEPAKPEPAKAAPEKKESKASPKVESKPAASKKTAKGNAKPKQAASKKGEAKPKAASAEKK